MSYVKYYTALSLLLHCTFVNGQQLISLEPAISLSKEIIQINIGTEVETGVDAYRITYSTTDVEGRLDTASGLLLIPQQLDKPLPLAIYQHGTVNSRADVPSELRGGWELGLALSAFGFITVAPDYHGLGTSRGIHPYVHADSEGLAAVDLLLAVQDFLGDLGATVTDQLFITGYSQGGHAAMAAHRLIQNQYSNQFAVTASAPMSGPYSLSGDMVEFTLGDREFEFPAYLAWTNLSFQRVYKDLYSELGEIFKEPYVESINQFAREEIDLGDLNAALRNLLMEESGSLSPRVMLRENILDIILSKEDHPINRAFEDNDVFNWAPEAPVRMMYCGMDEQVFFQNALTAEETMTALGASDVKAVLIDENGNHGSCIRPAALATIDFFLSFLDQTSFVHSPDNNLSQSVQIVPNPASTYIILDLPENFRPESLYIYNSVGQIIVNQTIKNYSHRFDVQNLKSGMYTLIISDGKSSAVKKLVVSKE